MAGQVMQRPPAAQRPKRDPGSIWPGMHPITADEFTRVGRGQPIQRANQFAQLHVRYFSIQDYATAGTTNLVFFNGSTNTNAAHTNLPQGDLPADRPFWLTHILVSPLDVSSAGARLVAESATAGASFDTASFAAIRRFSEIRSILQAGKLTLRIADRVIHEGHDLTSYPQGGGFCADAAQFGLAAAAASSAVVYSNGAPVASNRFALPRPYPVLPGKLIRAEMSWGSALAITVALGLKLTLCGESVQPLNQ